MPGCCNRILQSMGNRWKKNTHTPTHAIYISTGFNGIFGGRHHWFSSRQQQAFYTFPLSKEGGLFSLRTHTHTKTPLPSLPSLLPVAITTPAFHLAKPSAALHSNQTALSETYNSSIFNVHTHKRKRYRSKHGQRSGQPGPAPPALRLVEYKEGIEPSFF